MSLFISFEGPDGSGKSTQARLLAHAMRSAGFSVVETREPGGTPLGERVRDVILDPESPRPTPLAMAFLLSASRSQHVTEVIEPALERGCVVISDRFSDSTLAYQGYGLGVPLDILSRITTIATGGLRPAFIIYVDVPPEVGLNRVATRGAQNRLDAEDLAFHRRVREGYNELIEHEPGRWLVVDGTQSEESVHKAILEDLERARTGAGNPI